MRILELRDQIPKNEGFIFYDLYTFDFFCKSESVNLSDFTMKLIEELTSI